MDGIIRSRVTFQEHTEELIHETTQPTEDLILSRNAELRKTDGAIQDLGSQLDGGVWGRQLASIPFIMYAKAIKDGYQLDAKDKELAGREMHRYLASEEGKKCLVRG